MFMIDFVPCFVFFKGGLFFVYECGFCSFIVKKFMEKPCSWLTHDVHDLQTYRGDMFNQSWTYFANIIFLLQLLDLYYYFFCQDTTSLSYENMC